MALSPDEISSVDRVFRRLLENGGLTPAVAATVSLATDTEAAAKVTHQSGLSLVNALLATVVSPTTDFGSLRVGDHVVMVRPGGKTSVTTRLISVGDGVPPAPGNLNTLAALFPAFSASSAGWRAWVDVAPNSSSGRLNTVLELTNVGVESNYQPNVTAPIVDFISDSVAGVSIKRKVRSSEQPAGTLLWFTVHYQDGVSTIADVEAAITALAGPDDLFGVKTPGTGATVLNAGDQAGACQFQGGQNVDTFFIPNGTVYPVLPALPDVPRGINFTTAGTWTGGDFVITGTDQFGNAQTETIATTGWPATTFTSAKVWGSYTVTKTAVGTTGTVTIGRTSQLGVLVHMAQDPSFLLPALFTQTGDGAPLVPVICGAADATKNSITPGGATMPDGLTLYRALVPVGERGGVSEFMTVATNGDLGVPAVVGNMYLVFRAIP